MLAFVSFHSDQILLCLLFAVSILAEGFKLQQKRLSMDFGPSSEAFMPDLAPLLESTLPTRIAEFLGEPGSLEQYRALSVWRSLSHINQAIAEGAVQAQKTANFAGCWNLTDAAAQYLAQCPQLQAVDFDCCGNLTDAAAQHLAQCPQLQTVNF